MIICLSFQFLCLSFYLFLLHYPKPCLVCSSNNHGYPYCFLILKKNASKIYPLSLTFAIGFGRKAFIRLRAFLSINWLYCYSEFFAASLYQAHLHKASSFGQTIDLITLTLGLAMWLSLAKGLWKEMTYATFLVTLGTIMWCFHSFPSVTGSLHPT